MRHSVALRRFRAAGQLASSELGLAAWRVESDRIRMLDLPRDGCLPSITEFIESAMKTEQSVGAHIDALSSQI
jgi:hypothetical protein